MKRIGILTSGGDCQGLNAAIRGVDVYKRQLPLPLAWLHDFLIIRLLPKKNLKKLKKRNNCYMRTDFL